MDKTTRDKLRRDVLIVLGFVLFLWVTMCFLMFSVLTAVGPSRAKTTIIVIGVAVLLFATLSLVALIVHLRRHRDEMYAEELRHAQTALEPVAEEAVSQAMPPQPAQASHSPFVKVFDIVFIMVLCFVTLLATMLLRGQTVNDKAIYAVGIPSALLTVVGFTVYFIYILRHSHRELKNMIDEMYSEEGDRSNE